MVISRLGRWLIECRTHHTHDSAHFAKHRTKYIVVARILRGTCTERSRRNYGNWGKTWAVLDHFLLIEITRWISCHFYIFPVIISLRSSLKLILIMTIFNLEFLVIIVRFSLIWAFGSLNIVMIVFNNVLFSDTLHRIWLFHKYLVIYKTAINTTCLNLQTLLTYSSRLWFWSH